MTMSEMVPTLKLRYADRYTRANEQGFEQRETALQQLFVAVDDGDEVVAHEWRDVKITVIRSDR